MEVDLKDHARAGLSVLLLIPLIISFYHYTKIIFEYMIYWPILAWANDCAPGKIIKAGARLAVT